MHYISALYICRFRYFQYKNDMLYQYNSNSLHTLQDVPPVKKKMTDSVWGMLILDVTLSQPGQGLSPIR